MIKKMKFTSNLFDYYLKAYKITANRKKKNRRENHNL